MVPVDRTKYKVNYFIGNDKSKWRTNIQTSKGVLYKELYRNIDLKVYGIENQIEYDFIVRPGGEVSNISFEYRDAEKTEIDKKGNLVIKTEFCEIRHARPVCYQIIAKERVEVEAYFKKIKDYNYGFTVEGYNKNYELIIDPLVLIYSTYLGGTLADAGTDIAVDSEGAAYLTGNTESRNFPSKSPIQKSFEGVEDVFVTKIDPSGNFLIYSTYLGGSLRDRSFSIAVDSEGSVYVTGYTGSTDFPTKNPFQRSYARNYDVFVTKINTSGDDFVYSTYLGGSNIDWGFGIAVDSEGSVYVTGFTKSFDFPILNPLQGSNKGDAEAFITKVDSTGDALFYSTYLGGSGYDEGRSIAVDSQGSAYVTGYTESFNFATLNPFQEGFAGYQDAFVTKINPSGNLLIYSTYLGGFDVDAGSGIAVDLEGAAYVIGWTRSHNFPTQNPIQESLAGARNAFVTKISASGDTLVYSTYLGASWDQGRDIDIDSECAAYVTGGTQSFDFPIKNPFQWIYAGNNDVFIAKINASGDGFIYSTYLGGSGLDDGDGIAVDSEGAAYITGLTTSHNFPSQNPLQRGNAGDYDAFITKLCDAYSLAITAGKGGTTYPSPGAYTCCSGTEAIIEAIPDMHYRFSHWSGDVSGTDNPITVTMDTDMSITANFIRIIYPPSNHTGQKVLNRSLSQAEYINVLTWQANPYNENIVKYRIYQLIGESKNLLIDLDANTFQYWHRRVEKDKEYSYAICAVNDEGREGDWSQLTVQ